MISLREHPHIQGLLLGTMMVLASAAAAPYALSVVTRAGDAPGSPTPVTTESTADAAGVTPTTQPPAAGAAADGAVDDTPADTPALASP